MLHAPDAASLFVICTGLESNEDGLFGGPSEHGPQEVRGVRAKAVLLLYEASCVLLNLLGKTRLVQQLSVTALCATPSHELDSRIRTNPGRAPCAGP